MSAGAEHARIRRILVALDASAASLAALDSAARLAAMLEAELLGIFVEDVNLLRLAALPFAREHSQAAGLVRRLEAADMERALRAQAREARAAIEQAAAQVSVRYSFRVTRGQVSELLCAAAEEADLVALGWAGATTTAVTAGVLRPILLLPSGGELRSPVAVIYDGSPAAARALELAAHINREPGEAITVLLTEAQGEEGLRLREEATARLESLDVTGPVLALVSLDPAGVAETLRRGPVGTLLLPAASPLADCRSLPALRDAMRCAVLLVR
jgi:nucleotide-binding universal stress UspA family protein